MEKVVHKFTSRREADEFDRHYYASLTPAERIEILLRFLEDTFGTEPRLERVLSSYSTKTGLNIS